MAALGSATVPMLFTARPGFRHCNSCGRDLPANGEHFYRARRTRRLESTCIPCRRAKARTYYRENRSVAARRAAA